MRKREGCASQQRREHARQDHAAEDLLARGTKRCGGFLRFSAHFGENRLERAHYEGKPDEGQRHHDTELRISDSDPENLKRRVTASN